MDRSNSKDDSAASRRISFPDYELIRGLCGEQNAHLKLLEKRTGVSLVLRGNEIVIKGTDWEVEVAEKVLKQLYGLLESDYPLYLSDIEYAVRIVNGDPSANLKTIFKEEIAISSKKKTITPKTINQKNYIDRQHQEVRHCIWNWAGRYR